MSFQRNYFQLRIYLKTLFERTFAFWLFPSKFQLTDVFVHILTRIHLEKQNATGYTE